MKRNSVLAALVLGLLAFTRAAYAQSFSIDWFTIAGGGGTSTGGAYAVSGTIGQADTGEWSGGNFAIEGGFWSVPPTLPTPGPAQGQIFVTNDGDNTIGKYTTSGATVNASLIGTALGQPYGVALSGTDLFIAMNNNTVVKYTTTGTSEISSLRPGLSGPIGIAVSGTKLFVANSAANTIGQYTIAGLIVNASLITGLDNPQFIAVSGANLFVANGNNGTVGEYTTSGALVNAAVLSGLNSPIGIAVSGADLFVVEAGKNRIGKYTTSGATVNASLVTGLNDPRGIAVLGTTLFVVNSSAGTIGEYTTSGALLNASLITGLNSPYGIAVAADLSAGPGTSTPIPGGTGNFTSVGAPSLSGTGVAFYGTGSGGQTGIYEGFPAAPIKVADLNTAIPNGTGMFTAFTVNGLPSSPAISGNNVAFFGSGSQGQQGIYSRINSTLIRVADTTTAIPNGSGVFTAFFPGAPIVPPDPSISGNNVAFFGIGSGGQQGIYAMMHSGLAKVADTGTTIPGGTGYFVAFQGGPVISGANVAFLGMGPSGQQGVYLSVPIAGVYPPNPIVVADTGTSIPSGTGHFTSFDPSGPITPAIIGQNVAFLGMGTAGQMGVYAQRNGLLAMVADLNTAIPAGIGNFMDFGPVSVSATDVAFLGTGSSGQEGIYDLTGGRLVKVVDLNTVIDGKTITGLMFANTGLDGDPLSYTATFSDGSQGIYTVNVAAEPALVPPRFVGPFISSSAGFVFNLALVTNQNYRIQASTNLTAWVDLTNILATSPTIQSVDPAAANFSRRFYRVISLP